MCVYCNRRGKKDWDGDNPVCGFNSDGSFNKDNWNCSLLNQLREYAINNKLVHYNMDEYLAVLTYDEMSDYFNNIDFNELDNLNISVNDDNFNINNYITDDDDDNSNYLYNGFVILRWYKNRGRIYQAYVETFDGNFRPLTRNIAERVYCNILDERSK